ncbi:MAG: hypothetical protein IKE65_02070 [Clostridia bacterium]|nr:hypothetical protein [Clostridia bacterium]
MTSAKLPKKLIIMNILDILNKYTDEGIGLPKKRFSKSSKLNIIWMLTAKR